jgi:WD40 repeat protein
MSGDAGIQIWMEGEHAASRTLPCPFPVTALAFSQNNRFFAASVRDGSIDAQRIMVWGEIDRGTRSSSQRKVVERILYPRGRSIVNAPIAYTASGALVAIVSAPQGPVLAVRPPDGTPYFAPLAAEDLDPTSFAAPVYRADFARDGTVFALGREDRNAPIELWSVATGQPLHELARSARSSVFAFSDDLVAAATSANVVTLWARRDGAPVTELRGDWTPSQDRIWALAVSPRGDLVAAGGMAGRIHIWSVERKAIVAELDAHERVVSALEFSPVGDRLASAGWDGTVRLWNTAEVVPH